MNKALVASFVAFLVLASCVSSPPPSQPEASGQETAAQTLNTDQSRARALVTGGADAGAVLAPAPGSSTTAVAAAEPVDVPPPPPGTLSPEEEAYLNNYLARLNYMVYFDESIGLNPQSAKIAVNQANR